MRGYTKGQEQLNAFALDDDEATEESGHLLSPGGEASGDGAAGAAEAEQAVAHESKRLLRRILQLEVELRVLRAQLDVRNEAFHALMTRLVAVEAQGAHHGHLQRELDRITRERDAAVELAGVLQNMKVFRYTQWPRALYGVLLRATGRR